MRHCTACHAVMSPLWEACMVCQHPAVVRTGQAPRPADVHAAVEAPLTPRQVLSSPPCWIKARWSREKGWIELYDPLGQCWHVIPAKGNPAWVYTRLQRKG